MSVADHCPECSRAYNAGIVSGQKAAAKYIAELEAEIKHLQAIIRGLGGHIPETKNG